MLTIEFEPALLSQNCECCSQEIGHLTRIVYWDGTAYAAYYALLTSKYYVLILISTGDWSKAGLPSDRVSFFVQAWNNKDNYQIDIGNAEDSPWGAAAIMGRTLDRNEAMTHPQISEVFHLLERILSEDMSIIGHLSKHQVG